MNARDIGSLDLQDVIQLAEASKSRGSLAEAASVYRHWVAANGEHASKPVALFNLGVLEAEAGNTDAAVASYEEAVSRAPAFAVGHINLGLAYEKQSRVQDAVACWEAAYNVAGEVGAILSPGGVTQTKTTALNHIGRLFESKKQYDLAEEALTKSLALNPKQADAAQHWVHLRQRQCKWHTDWATSVIPENFAVQSISPLACLAYTDDPVHHLAAAQSFVSRKFPYTTGALWTGPLAARDKVRIGYVSGDLCTHAVGLLMAPWLQAHDKSKFEIFGFDFSPEDGSQTRAELKQIFDYFISIKGMSDDEAAVLIRRCDIDVLVDMHGLSSGARPKIFAQRPAAANITLLGFLGTTAMPWNDYVLADDYVIPAATEKYYSESVIRLPNSVLPVVRPGEYPTPVDSEEAVKAKVGARTLGCLNNGYKYTPEIVSIWGRVLAKNKDWKLNVLKDNELAAKNIHGALISAGADRAQIEFVGRGTYSEYLAKLSQISLYLDTFPYNAGSTARDVLIANTPLLTLCGKDYMSRVAASILSHQGLTEGVAHSLEDYEEKLLRFVKCEETLTNYTKKIHATLFNTQAVKDNVDHFERLVVKMLKQIEGTKP